MFIEDVVVLINKFSEAGISKFEIEFENDKLYIYTDNYVVFKVRGRGVLYPMGPISNRKNMYRLAILLEGTNFLADGKVCYTSYSYNPNKEDIRTVVREEIDNFLEEKYHGRITLMKSVVQEEVEKYMKERIKDVHIVIK